MLTLGSLVFTANAQEAPKYRRSALSMIRIDGKFATPNDDQVDQAWNSYPFPDKYDKLDIKVRSQSCQKSLMEQRSPKICFLPKMTQWPRH